MSTASAVQLPMTQTLGLLDCVDTMRQQEIAELPVTPVQDPLVLREHLQSVCASMAQPLSADQATKAVTLYLDKAAGRPMAPSTLLMKDRPTNEVEWRHQQQEVAHLVSQKEAQVKQWGRHAKWISTVFASGLFLSTLLGLFSGLGKLLTLAAPGGSLDAYPLGKGVLICALIAGGLLLLGNPRRLGRRTEKLGQEWKTLRARQDGLRDVKVDNRPNQQKMKSWLRAPGAAAAFYQIHVSGVPLLEQDLRAFKRAIEGHNETLAQRRADEQARQEEEARRERDREWTKEFEALALTHLDVSSPSS